MYHQIGPEVGRMDSYLGTYPACKEMHYKNKGPKQLRSYYDMSLKHSNINTTYTKWSSREGNLCHKNIP